MTENTIELPENVVDNGLKLLNKLTTVNKLIADFDEERDDLGIKDSMLKYKT